MPLIRKTLEFTTTLPTITIPSDSVYHEFKKRMDKIFEFAYGLMISEIFTQVESESEELCRMIYTALIRLNHI